MERYLASIVRRTNIDDWDATAVYLYWSAVVLFLLLLSTAICAAADRKQSV
jgi:hypothetical protein